ALVEGADQVELAALVLIGRLAAYDIGHRRIARLEDGALVGGGQEAAVEVVQAARRNESAVEDEEAGQVLALAAPAVAEPRAHARPTLNAAAGVQEVVGAGVLGELRHHRADDGQIIGAAGDVREQLADPQAALAVPAELPRRGHHLADIVELRRLDLEDAV